jgi:crotonobetainyl-CoA:carnitine CoA-transferase CaiB-like acyl-CoA transferase
MFDCQLSLLNYMATMYFMSGKEPGRCGNGHFVHVPYNTFRTQTRHVVLAVITDASWAALTEVLGDDALKRPEFSTQPMRLSNRTLIESHVQRVLETRPCEYWLEEFARAKIPAAPVNGIADAFSDPQVAARDMKVTVPLPDGGNLEQPGNPVKLSETFENVYRAPPRLGQHTRSVFEEFLKIEPELLKSLCDAGVLELAP